MVDVAGFNNRDDSAWVERLNIPGILRVGGFDTAIACAAPRPIMIHNTTKSPHPPLQRGNKGVVPLSKGEQKFTQPPSQGGAYNVFDTNRVKELYDMLGAGDNLRVDAGQRSDQEILDWLTK